MNSEELTAAVDELDQRLERLRVLYDQYFQGIEKIPPSIPQKDVDRRIWILRREKIRNTGTRFKFQQIVQRYNTFGSYWMRIMREIENGTYKRDVLRAKKRFGIDVVHPNAKVVQPEVAERKVEREVPESLPPPSHDLSLDDLEDDSDTFDNDSLAPVPAKVAPPTPPPRPPTPSLLVGRPSTGLPPARPPTAVPPNRSPTPMPPRKLEPAAAQSVNKLLSTRPVGDDDLDDMLDMALGPAARGPSKSVPPVARPQPAAPAPVARPQPAAPAPVARPQPPPPSAHVANPGNEEYRRVYAAYVDARRKNGESTAGLTYDSLAKSLKDTTEKLKTKANGKAIDFEVTTKDGRTILKPVVK